MFVEKANWSALDREVKVCCDKDGYEDIALGMCKITAANDSLGVIMKALKQLLEVTRCEGLGAPRSNVSCTLRAPV
jgi:hypothetical protein